MSRANEMHGFLPDDYIERKVQIRTNILWALIFVIVAGGIGAAFFIAQKKVKDAEVQNQEVNQRYAAASKLIEQFQRMQDEQQKLNKQAELAYSLVEKVNRSNILATLTNGLPKNTFLVDFTLDGKRKTDDSSKMTSYQRTEAAKAGVLMSAKPILYDVTMKVKGLAFNPTSVADYAGVLQSCPLFKEVNILEIKDSTYRGQKLRSFELEVVLDPTADSHAPATPAPAQPRAAAE
jgi:Tfp pilus assembly protein PilN